MSPEQCREARRLLGWSRERLGAMSEASAFMVQVFENEGRLVPPIDGSCARARIAAARATLEQAGVVFTDGAEPGVKLRKAEA